MEATTVLAATHAPAPAPGPALAPALGAILGPEAVAAGTQVGALETDTATPAHPPGVVGMDPGAEAGMCGLVQMGGEGHGGGLGPEVSETRKCLVCMGGVRTLRGSSEHVDTGEHSRRAQGHSGGQVTELLFSQGVPGLRVERCVYSRVSCALQQALPLGLGRSMGRGPEKLWQPFAGEADRVGDKACADWNIILVCPLTLWVRGSAWASSG